MISEATENRGRRSITPARLSHAVLRTTRPNEMLKWYTTVLSAQVLYHNDFMSFITYDDEHHRIALVSFPGVVEKAKRSAGLDHLAFFYSTLRTGSRPTSDSRRSESPRECQSITD